MIKPVRPTEADARLSVGQRLALLRRARGLSQRELAERLGCSQQLVSRWEMQDPGPREWGRLAHLLGVPWRSLVLGIDKRTPTQGRTDGRS